MKSSGYDNDLLYTPLNYNRSFERKFDSWYGGPVCNGMLNLIGNCFGHKYDDFGSEDEAVTFMSIPNVNGLTYVYNPKRWDLTDFEYLLYHFRIQLMSLHFDLVVSRNEYLRKGNDHFVRNMFFDNEEKDVKILLSLVYENNQVKLFKFCHSTTHKKPLFNSFSYLIRKICQL